MGLKRAVQAGKRGENCSSSNMTAFIGLVDRKPAYLGDFGDFADKGRPSLRAAYWNLKGQDIAVTALSY